MSYPYLQQSHFNHNWRISNEFSNSTGILCLSFGDHFQFYLCMLEWYHSVHVYFNHRMTFSVHKTETRLTSRTHVFLLFNGRLDRHVPLEWDQPRLASRYAAIVFYEILSRSIWQVAYTAVFQHRFQILTHIQQKNRPPSIVLHNAEKLCLCGR